jgi:hypothetical protein
MGPIIDLFLNGNIGFGIDETGFIVFDMLYTS